MKEKLMKVINNAMEQIEYYSDEIKFWTLYGIGMITAIYAGMKIGAWWLKKIMNKVLDERGI